MTRPASKHPTELELEILKVLWAHGPATVREVQERLRPTRKRAYTSVMTIMKIMTDKGYLEREREGAGYRYAARLDYDTTVNRVMGDVVKRLFGGSPAAASLRLLETAELEDEELQALRALLRRKAREKADDQGFI